jgi:raffinose/stachyose/melibiose transport system permease protein
MAHSETRTHTLDMALRDEPAAARRRKDVQLPQWLVALLFIAPALIVYVLYVIYPIFQSALYSLRDWSGIGEGTYIGLANYREALTDKVFWGAFQNNVILVVASIMIQLPVALMLALLLSSRFPGWRIFRAVYFLPLLLSTVAIGLVWINVYDPTFGLLNGLLEVIGAENLQQSWLGNPSLALPSIIAIVCWQYIPFYMILFIAGLTTIPDDLYEAAKLDGASGWDSFWGITLPLLRPITRTAAILSLIGSLKFFDLVWVMTRGGPNRSTDLMATYMFEQAFASFRMGYGSAIAMLLFIFAFVIAGSTILLDQRRASRQG